MSKALVIYHANCSDGMGAAWAFSRLQEQFYEDVQYKPMGYGKEHELKDTDYLNKDVFILDFSFSRKTTVLIAELAVNVVIIDHHKTAQAELENWDECPSNVEINFDMNRSGAGMAWDILGGLTRPELINYIEDRDLWKFILPDSRAVSTYIQSKPFTLAAFNGLAGLPLAELKARGEAQAELLSEIHETIVATCGRKICIETPSGIKQGLVCNTNAKFASDVGNLLAQESKTFGATYYTDSNNDTCFSLRSIGDYDVSEIAKLFGGGGHKNAAGFRLTNPMEDNGITLWSEERYVPSDVS